MANEREQKLANTTFQTLCDTLDARAWRYEKSEEELEVNFRVRGDDLPIAFRIQVLADKQMVSLFSPLPFNVPEERRKALAVAVGLANDGMDVGGFDYKYTEGIIVFRIAASFRESLLGKGFFDDMINRACYMIDKYNDKFFVAAKTDMDYDKLVETFNE